MINNKVISQDLRNEVLTTFNFSCKECKRSDKKLDLHHIIPRKQGGPNTLENLIPLCPSCHKKIDLGPERLKEGRVPLTCLIPKDLIKQTKQHAINHDTSVTQTVIIALKEYLEKYPNKYTGKDTFI